jgi:hypothetical protein
MRRTLQRAQRLRDSCARSLTERSFLYGLHIQRSPRDRMEFADLASVAPLPPLALRGMGVTSTSEAGSRPKRLWTSFRPVASQRAVVLRAAGAVAWLRDTPDNIERAQRALLQFGAPRSVIDASSCMVIPAEGIELEEQLPCFGRSRSVVIPRCDSLDLVLATRVGASCQRRAWGEVTGEVRGARVSGLEAEGGPGSAFSQKAARRSAAPSADARCARATRASASRLVGTAGSAAIARRDRSLREPARAAAEPPPATAARVGARSPRPPEHIAARQVGLAIRGSGLRRASPSPF